MVENVEDVMILHKVGQRQVDNEYAKADRNQQQWFITFTDGKKHQTKGDGPHYQVTNRNM